MQKVSKKAKITVEHLMWRETPLGRLSGRAVLATPYLVGFMTLLLTLYLAFQSSELHKADLALREYQDLESERLQEKIYHAWKMYLYEHVLNVKGPPLAQLDGYQQLVDDSKRLYQKRSAVQELLIDSSVIRYLPKFFEFHGSMQSAAVGSDLDVTPDENQELVKPDLDCSKEPEEALSPISSDKPAAFGRRIELDNYRRSIACFVQSLLIGVDYDYPMVSMIYQTRNKVNLLVSWMLPGLYGLLGACVFLMRELLLGNRGARRRPHCRHAFAAAAGRTRRPGGDNRRMVLGPDLRRIRLRRRSRCRRFLSAWRSSQASASTACSPCSIAC